MAFPQTAAPTVTNFTNATTHLVTMPPTVNAGDLLLAFISNDGAATITTPTGWTSLATSSGGGGNRYSKYYKIADGTEDGTTVDFVTSASETMAAQVYRVTAWHGTTPPEVGTMATGNSTIPDPPTLTPSWGAEDTLYFVGVGTDAGSTATAYPTNYTDGVTASSGGAGACGIASARRELNATSDDPATFTITSTSWVTDTLAVRPAAGGAATVTPAVVAVVVTVPTPTVLAAATVTPAVVAAVVTVPTPTVTIPGLVTPAVVALTTTVPTPTILAASRVTPAVVAAVTTVPTPSILAASVVTPAVVALVVTIPTPAVMGGEFGQTYIGTSTVGGSNHSMLETESYVKLVSLQAGWIVSHVEAFLRTTDNEFVMIHPVIYLDNAGDPGQMVVAPQFPGAGVEFDGTDRWWPMATGYAVPTTGDYWVGVHAFTAGSLQIAHDSGPDQEVTSGGSWVNEAAGSGGGLTSDGRNYSIRASIIAPTTITKVGRLTTGASDLDLGAEVRLIPVTITAGKVLLSVEADIKVHTASVPSIRGMLYSNNGGVPGIVLHAGPWAGDSWLIADTYRRFSFPMGRWVETSDDYWIGVQMGDAGAIHLAFDGTGGSGGNLASDTDGATWTPESDNYSISGTLAA